MEIEDSLIETVKAVAYKLLIYCHENDWAGYDPYDAVNSKLFQVIPFSDNRIPRLLMTQLLKRIPINLRRPLLVPKTQNPKGLALFLSAIIKYSKYEQPCEMLVGEMIQKIASLRSPGSHYWCWGYSFPWQTRTVLVPRFEPNLVCTTFVANALLDAYEFCGKSDCLEMATSAVEYIFNELYWTEGKNVACYSYPLPTSRGRVHNSNFLGAALCCRIYSFTGERRFLDSALKVAKYSASQQQCDGSWYYGEHDTQRWIDNFHTGFNLCALRNIKLYVRTSEFDDHIKQGFEFYQNNFFTKDGAPKYFHNRTYPIDIHSVAQSLITLMTFKNMVQNSDCLASDVFRWAMKNLWDNSGYFYYRVHSFLRIKIPYMRWSQAWMLLALCTFLEEYNK